MVGAWAVGFSNQHAFYLASSHLHHLTKYVHPIEKYRLHEKVQRIVLSSY